jgi:hypothetical protein
MRCTAGASQPNGTGFLQPQASQKLESASPVDRDTPYGEFRRTPFWKVMPYYILCNSPTSSYTVCCASRPSALCLKFNVISSPAFFFCLHRNLPSFPSQHWRSPKEFYDRRKQKRKSGIPRAGVHVKKRGCSHAIARETRKNG